MPKRPISEKAKPFRLVKYFSLSSLILIFGGTIVLSVLNTHWIRSMQFTKSEDYALLLIENLNHQVFMQFILPVGLKYGKIELRHKDQFERMDSVVRSTLHSFKVDMVNIYGIKDLIAYSYSKEMIGYGKSRRIELPKGIKGRADL
jgi:two-component system sensor histidine kinase HydH